MVRDSAQFVYLFIHFYIFIIYIIFFFNFSPLVDPKDIHVVQNLSFSLGLTGPGSHTPVGIGYRIIEQQQQQNSPASMATVCRISRTQLFPPQFKTLQDWFLYAFANSRLDGNIQNFRSLE